MRHTFPLIALGTCLLGAVGCSSPQAAAPDHAGYVPQAMVDSLERENKRTHNELAYVSHLLETCMAPQALVLAEYHVERGEHSKAAPHIEKAKAHGGEHAKKAADLEKRMTTTSTETVAKTDLNEHIEVVKDEADGITWYYDRRVARRLDTTAFYLYIGHKATGAPWLRMHTQYAGNHWLYINSFVLRSGRVDFVRHPDPTLMFSKAGDLTVTEWNDTPPSLEDLRVIREIIGSPDAEISFVGTKETYTRKITDVEREAFANILKYYQLMGRVDEDKMM
ncbi:MAG TPA: hypothetical protein PKE21_03785 [Flavobacteriales bacterium]|nr:hypothetical protein [Flavobacteriales bacterium]HMR26577.1 hypothetical protein [Flavobacteriales bacterium]